MAFGSTNSLRGMAAALLCLAACQPAAAQERVPIEAFFRYPALGGATISPTGRHLGW